MDMINSHHQCRLCDSGNIEEVIDLGCSPLANAYLTEAQLSEVHRGKREEVFTPLRCFLCMDCGSVQLSHSVPSEVLFGDYLYASSTSPNFVRHFHDLASKMMVLGLVDKGDLVVDIGSNDGIALKAFKAKGCQVCGVEPSERLASLAQRNSLPTVTAYLNDSIATGITNSMGPAKLVLATNVFAHLSDLKGFVRSVQRLLDKNGVFVFEVSYLGDVVDNLLFDTIYMEHQFYHSLQPLYKFMDTMGLPVFRVERIKTHGGSIRVFCGNRTEEASVNEMLCKELHLSGPDTYRTFMDRLHTYKHRLHSLLRHWNPETAFGCPAKFTTFCHALGLEDQFIQVVDESPLKVGMFTPGTHLPIIPNDSWDDLSVLVSAWNFFDPIYTANNGKAAHWIRPLPKLEVLP